MAKRSRYRQMEDVMTKILIADALIFIVYMVSASTGIIALKVITAIVAILASLLCLGFLYISGEILRRRSLWMVTGFGAVALCTLVSLILKFPCPPIV